MTDLVGSWNQVVAAAQAAQRAAETYQQAGHDSDRPQEERIHARREYQKASELAHRALLTVEVGERDELWEEVVEVARQARATGQAFFSTRLDLSSSEAERATAQQAYDDITGRLAALLADLEVIKPQTMEQAPEAEVESLLLEEQASSQERESRETGEVASESGPGSQDQGDGEAQAENAEGTPSQQDPTWESSPDC